ncbi:MAG: AMIN-like domain-containing (lipo)protein [Actinomycetota bacterium]
MGKSKAGPFVTERGIRRMSTPITPELTNIRTGRHDTFDRVVLDFNGVQPGATFELVDELIEDGSGEVVWLTGCQFVAVRAEPAAAHDEAGNPTYTGPRKFRTRNLVNVMAVAITGDFEAVLGVGLGLRHTADVKVFTLTGPTRVVIDVSR